MICFSLFIIRKLFNLLSILKWTSGAQDTADYTSSLLILIKFGNPFLAKEDAHRWFRYESRFATHVQQSNKRDT